MIYWVNQFAVTPDHPGGTRHHEMAAEMIRRGRDVVVVASDLNLTLRRYLHRDGASDGSILRKRQNRVRHVWLPAGDYEENDWRRALSMMLFALHVVRYLVVHAPTPCRTVFVGSTPHLVAAAGTWAAARLRGVPFVLEVRDLWPESLVEVASEPPGLVVTALRWLSDFLYRRADAVIVLAKPNIERLVARGARRERIHYIPNGVDVASFEGPKDRCSIDLDSEEKVFVYAGAHGPANGLDVAIRAGQRLENRGRDDVRILLVGDGPAKDDLRDLAHDLGVSNVTFADPIPSTEIPDLLDQAHGALMLLADVELFRFGVSPNKLFDYLMAGVPVIANVPGEVERMVSESGGGVVVPPANPEALADAIVEATRRGRRRTDAPDWVRKNHARRRLATDLLEVVNDVAT